MNVVYIVLAIAVLAVVIGAVVIFRKQAPPVQEAPSTPSLEERAPEPAEEAAAKREVEEAPARTTDDGGEATAAAAAGSEAPQAVPEAPPPKPEPTPEELREEVEKLLAESDRMLNEFRDLKSAGEEDGGNGMVDVLAEGLQEVRSLADRDKWLQARDKAEALRSQLVIMLRSTRREQES